MKTMRYILVFLLSLVFCFGLVAAEKPVKEKKAKKTWPEFPFKRFYVDAYVGYGFPLTSVKLTGDYQPDFDYHACTMGEGLRVGINFAYNFNKYLSLELGGMCVAYLNTDGGGLWWLIDVFDTVEQDGESHIVSRKFAELWDSRNVESHMGQFSIQLVASPGFARWNPYVKAGLGFVAGKLEARQRYVMLEGWTLEEELYCREYAFKQSYFHLGFVGAIGLSCHLSKTISLFFEWQFSVYGISNIYWGDGVLQSETGDAALVSAFGFRTDRLVDGDHVSFSSHGLNIGVKFKF